MFWMRHLQIAGQGLGGEDREREKKLYIKEIASILSFKYTVNIY